MSDSSLIYLAEHELKYQARKAISKKIRENSSESEPMTTGITVMLGTFLAMAVFNAIITGGKGKGR
jgi:hypothetical protein